MHPCLPALQLNDEGPADDDEGEEGVPSYREWALPAREFEGMWDRWAARARWPHGREHWGCKGQRAALESSPVVRLAKHAAAIHMHDLCNLLIRPLLMLCACSLYYESSIKRQLLKYAASALLFSRLGVDSHKVSWNRCGEGGGEGCQGHICWFSWFQWPRRAWQLHGRRRARSRQAVAPGPSPPAMPLLAG